VKHARKAKAQSHQPICRYLLSTKSEGLHLNPIKDSGLEGKIEIYVDASYGGEEARCNSNGSQSASNVVLSKTGYSVTVNNGGGIYRLQRGGERCELDSTIPERVTTNDRM
jgi:hypothetical protein